MRDTSLRRISLGKLGLILLNPGAWSSGGHTMWVLSEQLTPGDSLHTFAVGLACCSVEDLALNHTVTACRETTVEIAVEYKMPAAPYSSRMSLEWNFRHWGRGPLETSENILGTLQAVDQCTYYVSAKNISSTFEM